MRACVHMPTAVFVMSPWFFLDVFFFLIVYIAVCCRSDRTQKREGERGGERSQTR
jgi:hypothetical protein